jgi:autotransporter translocation and assembly factor TamB
MQRSRRWRGRAAVAGLLLCAAVLAFWQRQALAQLAIVGGVEAFTHERLSFTRAQIGLSHALLQGVRITSFRNEPVADIAQLDVTYDLRDIFPGGRRLFGLKTVDVESPHVTIIRRSDGTYNLPIPGTSNARARAGTPLIVRARIRGGSIEVVDQSAYALPGKRRLYAEDVEVDAGISTQGRSTYTVTLDYGERANRLYAVKGRGVVDLAHGYDDQHWSAAQLPIAGAVNFAVNSASLRLRSGVLQDVDARYFEMSGASAAHLVASAFLRGCNLTVAGLSKPVTGVRGPIDVYDDGILTPGLQARLAGVPAVITGGMYGLDKPQLRVGVRGSADLAQLQGVFAGAQRLPVHGPIGFSLLIEGSARQPLTWIALRSPTTTYAGTRLRSLNGVVAFDGREADIVRFGAAYGRASLNARGRITLKQQHNAVEVLAQAHSPAGGTPYISALLPQTPLRATVLATADDPKAIAARGVLWGDGGSQALDAIFKVDAHGNGTIGPLYARSGRGSLYARVTLDNVHGQSLGLAEARGFPLPAAKGTLNATLFGSRTAAGFALAGDAGVASAWGVAAARGRVAMRHGAMHGAIFGNLGSVGSFGAIVGGAPRSPTVAGTVVIAGGRYRNVDVAGNAALAYENGNLAVHDAAAVIGPLFVGVAGTIEGLSLDGVFAPRYDLATQLYSSDVSSLVAAVAPQKAALVQGSVGADLRVRGGGTAPSFSGRVNALEGSINGLSFRNFAANVSGDGSALTLTDGRVVIGSSAIALSTSANRAGAAYLAIDSPRVDLADFNDFFDTGDTFAGTGSLAVRAQVAGTRVLSTSGDVRFSNARLRRIDLGSVAARWNSRHGAIASVLRVGGPSGELTLNGTVAPASRIVNLRADARRVDLATWLPMLGYDVPVTGRLDAQTRIAGTYPDVAMHLHAAVFGGTIGRMTLERFELGASAAHGRGTIESAVFDVPSMTTVASGTFGLRDTDALALVVRSASPNLGDFLAAATGKHFAVSGTLSSTLRIEGVRAAPQFRDSIALQNVDYRNLKIARVAGEIDANRRSVAVRNAEIDIGLGKALISAAMPVRFSATGIAPGSGAIAASVIADDMELSNLADLLPKGSQLSGRIDGRVDAAGSVETPVLNGALTLTGGTFNGPMERSPITGVAGTLTLRGTHAQLQSHAVVGSGIVTASAIASLADLRRPADVVFALNGRADNARLDLPGYFAGNLNGSVALVRRLNAVPALSGDLSVSNARVPLTAFLNQKSSGAGRPAIPDIALNGLEIAAGPNVRVASANVDIGATGAVQLNGTLDAPSLSGTFRSTGGSLAFYRSFNLESGTVTFDPSGGLVPAVDAVATTFVPDPATAVRLHASGTVTNMNLSLDSDPPYSKQQILGLLVGAQQFGAVQGVASTGRGSFSTASAAQGIALGQLNTVFTRNLLEPLSASMGGAAGTEVQITSDIQTGLGLNAVKAFGKFTHAIYTQTFGYPRTQSVALEANPNPGMGLRLSAYSADGPTLFGLEQPQPAAAGVLNVNPATSFTPIGGSNGLSFSVLRRFW